MKIVTTIVLVLALISLLILLTPSVCATYYNPNFSGYLTYTFYPSTAQVGDNVTLTIHPVNTGIGDWENVEIYAPIPAGLEYESFICPDRTNIDYNPVTGIWDVMQMKAMSRGDDKEGIITLKVLPQDAGKTITITAGTCKFISLMVDDINGTVENAVAEDLAPPYQHDTTLEVANAIPPIANYAVNTTSGNVPLNVQFTDTSSNSPTSWLWNFGDGGTSTQQNPSHIYTTSGTYSVTLTATNSVGNNTIIKNKLITVTIQSSKNPKGPGTTTGIPGSNPPNDDLVKNPGNAQFNAAINNITASKDKNPLISSQSSGGGGGGGKASEIIETPANTSNSPQNTYTYFLAVLLIIGTVVAGYLYEMKDK